MIAATSIASFASSARAEEPVAEPASSKDAAGKGALIPADVDPGKDAAALEKQPEKKDAASGKKVADANGLLGGGGAIYSEDWWRQTRPVVEIHGFFRTRADLFYNFTLGHADVNTSAATQQLFPQPIDNTYNATTGNGANGGVYRPVYGCGSSGNAGTPIQANQCYNKTNASANMRFRIDPEIHVSDNLRIISEIDLLDNLVLGSTPDGSSSLSYSGGSAAGGKWYSFGSGGYVPYRAFSSTQVAPIYGVNSYTNSVSVKRVWGEFNTPLGQLRFGRMPSNWGLGILANAGDKIDSDYQTTTDRILFVTGVRQWDTYVAGSWDFPASGTTSASPLDLQGQPYNISQLDAVQQWVLAVFRKVRPEVAAKKLARGEVVMNGGLYALYRQQLLANETTSNSVFSASDQQNSATSTLVRINAKAAVGDLWFQLLTKKLRWETEAVYLYGSIENPLPTNLGSHAYPSSPNPYQLRQFGVASELEYTVLNDDLRLRFYTGYASGDNHVTGIDPGSAGLQARADGNNTVSTFRFHPDYRVDLILFRNILSRVEGAYYFRPGVEYDFIKSPDGEKFGGRADVVYSRAAQFVQWPGHKEDLGVEIDLSLYYQSRDGSLNDDPTKIGGFYAMLQYGVLFPLGGLGWMSRQVSDAQAANTSLDTSSAQIVRLFLGVAY